MAGGRDCTGGKVDCRGSVLDINLIPIEILKITINSIPSQIHDKLEGEEVPV
jgi:hypothetical protein